MLIHRDSLWPSCRRAENQNWRRKRELSWKPPAIPVPAHCRHVTGVRPHLVLLRDISWGTDICAVQAGHHQQTKETVVPGVAEQAMTSLDLQQCGQRQEHSALNHGSSLYSLQAAPPESPLPQWLGNTYRPQGGTGWAYNLGDYCNFLVRPFAFLVQRRFQSRRNSYIPNWYHSEL